MSQQTKQNGPVQRKRHLNKQCSKTSESNGKHKDEAGAPNSNYEVSLLWQGFLRSNSSVSRVMVLDNPS